MPEKKKINMAETAVDVFEEAKQLKKKDKTTITINESSPANHCIEEQDVILPPNARCLFEIDPYLIPYKKQIHEYEAPYVSNVISYISIKHIYMLKNIYLLSNINICVQKIYIYVQKIYI